MIAADSIILATELVAKVEEESPKPMRPDAETRKRMIIRIAAAIEGNVLTLGDRVLLDPELRSLKAASDIVKQVFQEEIGWEPRQMILPSVFEQRSPLPELAAEYGMHIPGRRHPSKEAIAIFTELIENPDVSREYERKAILVPEYPFDASDPKHLVAVEAGDPKDKFKLLDAALDHSCFFEHLNGEWKKTGKSKTDFSIVIKTHLITMLRRDEVGVYTDPTIVLRLVSRLMEAGYTNVTVAEGRNSLGNSLGGRGVVRVAARAGYIDEDSVPTEGKSPARITGRVVAGGKLMPFELVDLSYELVEHEFAPDLIGRQPVSKVWRDADYRISFGKLKTHFSARYALNLINVSLALPMEEKILQYPTQLDAAKAVTALIEAFPVHFSLIDGITAADGVLGYVRRPRSRVPGVILAGQSILAVESLGAQMMGVDPFESIYTQIAAERLGGMTPYKVIGDPVLMHPWKNVRNVLVELLTTFLERMPNISNFWLPLVVGDPDPCFPMKGDSKQIARLRRLAWLFGSRPLGFWLTRRDGLAARIRNSLLRRKIERNAFKLPLSAGYSDFYEEARHLRRESIKYLLEILNAEGAALQKGEKEIIRAGHIIVIGDKHYPVFDQDAISAICIAKILKGISEGRWTASQLIQEMKQWLEIRVSWKERRRIKKEERRKLKLIGKKGGK